MDHFARLNKHIHETPPETALTKREYIGVEFIKILMSLPATRDRYLDKDLMIRALKNTDEFLTLTHHLPVAK